MVNKLEETEKRRQDIVSKRDAEIEAKKGTEDEDDLLLQDLASNMMKKGKLKYAIDRQGKLGSGSRRKSRTFSRVPDQSHIIFEINVGKRRIRHTTILKLNFLID